MKHYGTIKILDLNNQAATGSFDFITGAAGVVAYIVTSDKQGTPDFTFTLGAITPNGDHVALISSAAVVDTNTSLRISVLPGVTAVANVIANDVVPGRGRFTYTKNGGGSYDLNVWLAFFG
jgi:hypothetical protein